VRDGIRPASPRRDPRHERGMRDRKWTAEDVESAWGSELEPFSPTEIPVATATVTARQGTPKLWLYAGDSRGERRRDVVIAAFVPSSVFEPLCHGFVPRSHRGTDVLVGGRVGVSECQDALVARSTRRVAIAPGRPSQLARGRLYERGLLTEPPERRLCGNLRSAWRSALGSRRRRTLRTARRRGAGDDSTRCWLPCSHSWVSGGRLPESYQELTQESELVLLIGLPDIRRSRSSSHCPTSGVIISTTASTASPRSPTGSSTAYSSERTARTPERK
jgi:hypothetical protein